MHILEEVAVLGARQLIVLELRLGIGVVLVEELEELFGEHHLAPDLMDGSRSLEELLQGDRAVLEPRLVLQVVLDILALEGLDLLAQGGRRALHDLLHGLLVLLETLLCLGAERGQVIVQAGHCLNRQLDLLRDLDVVFKALLLELEDDVVLLVEVRLLLLHELEGIDLLDIDVETGRRLLEDVARLGEVLLEERSLAVHGRGHIVADRVHDLLGHLRQQLLDGHRLQGDRAEAGVRVGDLRDDLVELAHLLERLVVEAHIQ